MNAQTTQHPSENQSLMSNIQIQQQTDVLGEPTSTFQGYTLQQMRARKAVNQVKIDLQKQKLIHAVKITRQEVKSPYPTLTNTMENVFRYAQIAIFSYKMVRRAINLYRSFRSAKSNND